MTSPLKFFTTVPALLLLLVIATSQPTSAWQQPAKLDCAKATDTEIGKAIYEKIAAKYASQKKHVNVSYKAGVATLRGWVTTQKAKRDIENIVKKSACVKTLISKLGVGAKTGCGPGMQKCGDVCIPADEYCNIIMNER